jgi:hypothetical protein
VKALGSGEGLAPANGDSIRSFIDEHGLSDDDCPSGGDIVEG